MAERRVYRIPRPADGQVTAAVLSAAAGANCPEIEFRDDLQVPEVFVETIQQALVIDSVPPVEAKVGQPYVYRALGRGEGVLTWEKVIGPAEFTIASATGEVTWTPVSSGIQTAIIKAIDANTEVHQTLIGS